MSQPTQTSVMRLDSLKSPSTQQSHACASCPNGKVHEEHVCASTEEEAEALRLRGGREDCGGACPGRFCFIIPLPCACDCFVCEIPCTIS